MDKYRTRSDIYEEAKRSLERSGTNSGMDGCRVVGAQLLSKMKSKIYQEACAKMPECNPIILDFGKMSRSETPPVAQNAPPAAADNQSQQARMDAYTSVRQDIAELVPLEAIRILDVGCSSGALGGYLKCHSPDRKVIGIEMDAKLAGQAIHVLDALIHSDLESLDLNSALAAHAPFDCIICADVLEHLRDPEKQLIALTKFLSPNGKLIVGLPNIRHHSALWEIFFRGHFPRRPRGIFDSTHLRWFTYSDGVDLLHSSNLQPERFAFSVRIGDKGGGLMNRLSGKLLGPIANWWLIREFFVYQFVMRAIVISNPQKNESPLPAGTPSASG